MDTLRTSASPLLGPEQQDLWRQVNDTAAAVPVGTIWDLFAEQAAAQPDRPAVIAERRTLSYGELAGLAAAVAARLQAEPGGGPVAICAEPGWEQVVAVMGALAAGIAFLPVEPGLSQALRWNRLAHTGVTAVLTQSWLEERMAWPTDLARVAVDQVMAGNLLRPGAHEPVPGRVACYLAAEPPDGAPIPVTGEALVQTVTHLARQFGLGHDDRVLVVSALGDVSLYAILGLLGVGGGIVIPDDIDLHAPPVWVTLMQREHVTVWHSPPALAAELAEHLHIRGEGVPPDLKVLLLGGEPLSPALAGRLRDLVGPGPRMANLGGVITGGLWASCQEISEPEQRRGHVPVGRPLSNKHLYVLADSLGPCPVWVTGRIYLGGHGLPAQSSGPADSFAVHPSTGERLYRTDLTGRLLPDGTLDVVADDRARITVSGHPLNLREVEALLAAHEAVLTAAVVPVGEGSVAYAKPAPGASVTGADLTKYLSTRMSPYLLPARVELVYAFPLTPGGRIDRAALSERAARAHAGPVPEQEPPRPAAQGSTGIRGDLTRPACALAARVLGIADVDVSANLLDLGATSVQLVRIAVQAEEELGIQADVEELLRFPSVTVLLSFADADGLDGASTGLPAAGTGPAAAEPRARPAGPPDGAPALILDPVDRMAFTDSRHAIRRDLDAAPAVDLVRSPGARERLGRRATYRTFGAEPVPATALGALMRALGSLGPAATSIGSADLKYAYPSAGSLYPVQSYVTVTEDRVTGIPAGAYYYHPVRHRLHLLDPDAQTDATVHAWVNRAAFRSSAFTIHLIANLDAISPMYGVRSRDYCLIEAGAMCQLLMTTAERTGLGLCPVGEMDFDRIRDQFRLGARQELLHALLGGMPAPTADGAGQAAMLRRVGSPRSAGDGDE